MSKTASVHSPASSSISTDTSLSREERFKALRSRLSSSAKANHADVIAEHKRMKLDPSQISRLERKKAEAEIKLAKQDAEDAGDDFERKRAWDWTMEESLAWDKRVAKKQQNRDEALFADYTQTAEKSYRRGLKGFKPDLEGYKRAKEEALASGQLAETTTGDLTDLDKDRRFYADANSLGLVDHKPSKEAVDRLVEETKKRYYKRFYRLIF